MDNVSFQLDLLKGFHEQFAQNQNHHQSMVIKFLAGLAILLVTFVYATAFQYSYLVNNKFVAESDFAKLILTKGQFIISDSLYFFLSISISFILSICFLYILQAAYIFRRDQAIVAKIRHSAGGECNKIFANYGQLKPKILWLPDSFAIILLLIGLIDVGVSVYVSFFSSIAKEKGCEHLIFLLTFFAMIISYIYYTGKYHKLLSIN